MTQEQFIYWLQGFSELNENAPTQEQWQSIKNHLATVYVRSTPPLITYKLPIHPMDYTAIC